MELYEYSQLPINDQADHLWANGEFMISCKEDNHSLNLYSFFGYYVEVKLSNADSMIVEIMAFKKGEHITKYLDFIDITTLM